MEDGVWDLSSIAEEDFDQLAVYLVPDQACDDTTHTSANNRAEASLPRNLILKPSQTLSDVSILFTTKPVIKNNFNIDFEILLELGSWCLEHRLHSKRHTLWPIGGRYIRQGRCP